MSWLGAYKQLYSLMLVPKIGSSEVVLFGWVAGI